MGLLAVACGDDGEQTSTTDGASPDQVADEAEDGSNGSTDGSTDDEPDDGDDDDSDVPDGVRLLCDVNAPVEVDLHSTTDGEIVESDDTGDYTHCYVVEVPAGTAELTVEISGLSGNLGLGVAYPDLDALRYQTEGYWRGPGDVGTADETAVIDAPEAGTYFIAVGPGEYQDVSTYTLTVSSS